MAATIAKVGHPEIVGEHKELTVDITCDNSYPAGGYPVSTVQLGGKANATVLGQSWPCYTDNGYVGFYIVATNKLKFFKSAGTAVALAEAGSTDLNGKVVRLRVAVRS